MPSDFSGLGTNVMIPRLLADLVASAYGAVSFVARQTMTARRPWLPAPLSATVDKLVGEGLRNVVESGCLKLSTAEKYRHVTLRFVATTGCGKLADLSSKLVEKHLGERAAHGLGNGGLRVELAALRTVLDRLLGMRTTAELDYAARPEPIVAASRELTTALLDAVANDQERILLLLLNVLKLRPGQIAGLRAEHVRLAERIVVVPHGRPGKYTLTPIPAELVGPLDGLLRQANGQEWLFSSPARSECPLTVRALQKRLARIASRCGRYVTCTAMRKAASLLQPADEDRRETGQPGARPASAASTMHSAAAPVLVAFPAPAPSTIFGTPRQPLPPQGDSMPAPTAHASHAMACRRHQSMARGVAAARQDSPTCRLFPRRRQPPAHASPATELP